MKAEIKNLLDKSSKSIEAGRGLLAANHAGFGAARGYYAMFYAAEALLASKGLRFRKHAGVHSAFGEYFTKTGMLDAKYHRWLLEAFGTRIQGDYGVDVVVKQADAESVLQHAVEFLAAARQLLG